MIAETWSYKNLLDEGEKRLKESGIREATVDAWHLFSHVTMLSRAEFFLRDEEKADANVVETYFSLLEKRIERIPVAYLTELRGFMGLDFFVNRDVLIPEQDTETLVEEVLSYSEGKDILDLCTGSGCIAVALAKYGKPRSILASDVSRKALFVANKNLDLLEEAEREKVRLRESDLFQNIEESFDLIVSNPPYIASEVIDTLEPEVRIYEPRLALDGSKDGLFFYRKIASEAPKYLRENGRLALEIGFDQAESVVNLLLEEGFSNPRVIKDLTGFDRVVVADLKKEELER